jgi:uncharacterized damage-inducible protein DinB
VDGPTIDDHGRPEPPPEADEVATLLGFLDFQRSTLEWKGRGLSDEQLRVELPPTSMTLGGLLKHLAYVENYWFTEVVAAAPLPEPWSGVDWDIDPDWEWRTAADDPGDELRTQWAQSVERSRAVVDARVGEHEAAALGETHSAWGGQGRVSLRWVLVHMIEEYARHNGHADLLRQSIDGETGE